jgi:hypothetical protein
MVRFPAPARALRRFLVDDFQCVALACPHSGGTQKRTQGADVAPLPSDDFAHVTFRDFQFDHVAIEIVHENLIGSINDPLRNLLDESAHISSRFTHGDCLCRWNSRGDRGLGEKLAHPL